MSKRHTQRPGNIHSLLAGGFLLLAAVCFLETGKEPLDRWKIRREYESLARIAVKETEGNTTGAEGKRLGETEPDLAGRIAPMAGAKEDSGGQAVSGSPVDFEKLRDINPDTVGWIRIPDTNIDYPIVQGSDNQAYLHKSFGGKMADGGCIFLDFESQRDLRGYNNIFYGHNMKDGTMFRDLLRYEDEAYLREHPYFEIYTPKKTIHLKALSCYYIQEDPGARKTAFHDEEDFQAFVRKMIKPCPYARMPDGPVKNLYTLVTCSYQVEDGRTILLAVEADGEQKME